MDRDHRGRDPGTSFKERCVITRPGADEATEESGTLPQPEAFFESERSCRGGYTVTELLQFRLIFALELL